MQKHERSSAGAFPRRAAYVIQARDTSSSDGYSVSSYRSGPPQSSMGASPTAMTQRGSAPAASAKPSPPAHAAQTHNGTPHEPPPAAFSHRQAPYIPRHDHSIMLLYLYSTIATAPLSMSLRAKDNSQTLWPFCRFNRVIKTTLKLHYSQTDGGTLTKKSWIKTTLKLHYSQTGT